MNENQLIVRIRLLVAFFIIALVLSGATAFPLVQELKILSSFLGIDTSVPSETYNGLKFWIASVNEGLTKTSEEFPFILYGTDWLAFAHIVIAVAFIGLYFKPVRNKWIITFGMIACASIIPLALICGNIRGIPFYWQLIDCSFGVFGFIPLCLLQFYVKKLEKQLGKYELKY
jgi:hypothetical protein